MVKIRRARKGDIPAIIELGLTMPELNASERTIFYEDSELYEWVTEKDEDILLVAEDQGKVVGFLFAKIISNEWCMLDNLGVEKSHRDAGTGSLLVKELEGILKIKNVNYIQGLVATDNAEAQAFWKSKGFKDGKTFIWMEKELAR